MVISDTSADNNIYRVTVKSHDEKLRLDKFLSDAIPDISRVRIQSFIKGGGVLKGNEAITDRSYRIIEGDNFTVTVDKPVASTMKYADDIPLNIIYEDEYLIVIDKQSGLTVHPGAGNMDNTMANALLSHCGDTLSGIGGVMRPGIVHRLDKDTSGLIVAAKDDKTHENLSSQLQKRSLRRVYNAVVWGIPNPPAGKIDANIDRSNRDRKKMTVVKNGGRNAITHYKVLKVLAGVGASLVECRLETGRTHQIRVHFLHKGYPLIGDQKYRKNIRPTALDSISENDIKYIKEFPRQALHSCYMGFTHSKTGEFMEFESKIGGETSKDIRILIEKLKMC